MTTGTDVQPPATATAPGGAGVEVQTQTTVTGPAATDVDASARVTKVIVAVHGIGDQYSYATIQAVVNRFCRYYCYPAAVPLGSFHGSDRPFSIQPPYPDAPFRRFAFAEVYWATIPRALVADRHTVEESKKWARTIVDRLWLRCKTKGRSPGYEERDFQLINQVLGEMIQTIAVLDRLFFLADKIGVFTFDLRRLLEDYLGDVQVVTEFGRQRGEILAAFASVMERAHAAYPNAELHVVAHSEGTVVSFLALLQAYRASPAPAWADQVRGFMTLGSPIDKHLVLWPELFGDADATPDPPRHRPPRPIEWRNYYDYGDPVGFALDDARAWIRHNGWTDVFDFTEAEGHDNGFSRYPFPGKAHVDYWNDDAVFGHFIETVIREAPPPASARAAAADYRHPPRDVQTARWISYVVPYLGVAGLLVAAAYILYRAVADAIDPSGATFPAAVVARGVAGIAALLLGVTAMARVPRLTRSTFWRATTVAVGVLSALLYLWSVQRFDATQLGGRELPPGTMTLAVAAAMVPVAYWASARRPSWGLRPLMIVGALGVALAIVQYLRAGAAGPVWPVLVAAAVFLYLWWLAALLFDLVFVWHVYVRHAHVLRRMDELLGGRRSTQRDPAGKRAVAAAAAPQVRP